MRPQLNPLILGPGAPWSLPGSSLDIQFTTGRAAVNRQKSSISSLLTTTRASTGYATTSTGSLTLFPANTPRITDLGLLVEQAATNLQIKSQQFTASPWAPGNGGGGAAAPTVTDNQAVAPDGTTTAALVQFTARLASQYQYVNAPQALSTGTYTGSLYFKAADGPSVGSKIDIWQFDGALKNLATVTLTASWQRLATTGVSSLTATGVDEADTFGRAASTGGGSTGAVNIHVWGGQIETGSFATSYIPTTTVSVTRAADTITLTNGTLPDTISVFASGIMGNITTSATLIGWGTASPNRGHILNAGGAAAFSNDSAGFNISATGTWVVGILGKIAARNQSGSYAVTFNGGSLGTSALAGGPSPITKVTLGTNVDGSQILNGYLSRIAIFKSPLTNTQLQALTV